MRKRFTPYVPPHRRSGNDSGEGNPPRTLSDLAYNTMWVEMISSDAIKNKAQILELCPFRYRQPTGSEGLKMEIPRGSTDEERNLLLTWFSMHLDNVEAQLAFPAVVTKEERAAWHRTAERLHLHSISQGCGEERRLTIFTRRSRAKSTDVLTEAQERQVMCIWDACQKEGGVFWEWSRGEIAEMLRNSEQRTDEFKRLVSQMNMDIV